MFALPRDVNLLIREMVGGMLLSDKLEVSLSSHGSFFWDVLFPTIEVFSNLLGVFIVDNPPHGFYTDWMTGDSVIDGRVAKQCFTPTIIALVDLWNKHESAEYSKPDDGVSDEERMKRWNQFFANRHADWRHRVIYELLIKEE